MCVCVCFSRKDHCRDIVLTHENPLSNLYIGDKMNIYFLYFLIYFSEKDDFPQKIIIIILISFIFI